jgi:hypothetical protein
MRKIEVKCECDQCDVEEILAAHDCHLSAEDGCDCKNENTTIAGVDFSADLAALDALSVDELITHLGSVTGLTL